MVPSKEELKLANLCIDYLNLPAFINPPRREGILNGDYGFMDYAVLFWIQHLEVGATLKPEENGEKQKEALMAELAESLGIFVNQYWNSPTAVPKLANRHRDKIQYFRAFPFYDRLEQAVSSTKRQLKHFGDTKKEEIALNIANSVCNIRNALEELASIEPEPTTRQIIEDRYGSNLFKCPQFSCQSFTIGFPSAEERKKHIGKHQRPFRCSDELCVVGYAFGFPSAAELEKHMKAYHRELILQDEEFPTEEEVQQSIQNNKIAIGVIKAPNPQSRDDGIEYMATAMTQRESEPKSEAKPQFGPRETQTRQTEFKCEQCNVVYKKRYNLQSHLLSHENIRPHACSVCHKDFARVGDLRRHTSTHTGEKRFVCSGTLRNGSKWGCGRSFARADTLRKHHESRVGRECILPLQQERENVYSGRGI